MESEAGRRHYSAGGDFRPNFFAGGGDFWHGFRLEDIRGQPQRVTVETLTLVLLIAAAATEIICDRRENREPGDHPAAAV